LCSDNRYGSVTVYVQPMRLDWSQCELNKLMD
jgi:hypothetical protein